MVTRFRWTAAASAILASITLANGPKYEITDLTQLAGVNMAEAYSINDDGEIVGIEIVASPELIGDTAALYWHGETSMHLELLPGDNTSWAAGINNSGVIAGTSSLLTVEHIHDLIVFNFDDKAVTWGDDLVELNTLVTGGDELDLQQAADINDLGQVVGLARSDATGFAYHGYLLDNGIVTDLGILPSENPNLTQYALPMAINNVGQVVGGAGSQEKAFLWENGKLTNLHDHPSIGGVQSVAWDINDSGIIVGEAQFSISLPEQACRWVDGVPEALGNFGFAQGVGAGINNKGQIVGWTFSDNLQNPGPFAFLWDDGELVSLTELIDPEEGWFRLDVAYDINEHGQIVGRGTRNGQLNQAFLLTPIVVEGDINGDLVVDLLDHALLVDCLTGPDAPVADGCDEADLNDDDHVDALDVSLFQASFGNSK